MAHRGRPFSPGVSGNPAGRPKGSKDSMPRAGSSAATSVKAAWTHLLNANPTLLEEAIRRGLTTTNSSARLGYVELGARLMKEIGPHGDATGGVSVIVVGHGAEVIKAYREAAARIVAGAGAPAFDEAPNEPLAPPALPSGPAPRTRRRQRALSTTPST